MLQSMYGVPPDRARDVVMAGAPSQVAMRLAAYVEVGAGLVVVACDPASGSTAAHEAAPDHRVAWCRAVIRCCCALLCRGVPGSGYPGRGGGPRTTVPSGEVAVAVPSPCSWMSHPHLWIQMW